ncbi:MAG TPA: PEP-CTERM sorting domain-containing protein [Gemmataceae bacterium]|nr:PEP-CTERM sorting domain-containing protein [Gemmataceae bacterium]
MRHTILVLAVAFVAGSAEARADMVTYYMTGTVLQTWHPFNSTTSAYAVGDRMIWTVQYDRSIPPLSPLGGQYGTSEYRTNGPVFSDIRDATTGSGFGTPSTWSSTSSLTNWWHATGDPHYDWNTFKITANQTAPTWWGGFSNYTASLLLESKEVLPTLNLANLPLNNIPLYSGSFDYTDLTGFGFQAQVNSISLHSAPEPGSLTLFLLGTAGLAARGMRRRLRQIS